MPLDIGQIAPRFTGKPSSELTEAEQIAHENIVGLIAKFVSDVQSQCSGNGFSGSLELSPREFFDGVADVCSDAVEGLSSGHLQGLRDWTVQS